MFLNLALSFAGTLLQEILYFKHRRSGMKREFEMAEALESRINEVFSSLMRKMETMNGDSTKFQESVWSELQLIREDLEKEKGKKEEDIATALESRMEKLLEQQAERYLLLKQELQKSQESTKSEVQLIRRYVEEKLGKKEEEIARGLDSRMEKELQHLFQKIQNLEQDLQKSQESTHYHLQLLRSDLENKLVLNEEKIAGAHKSVMEEKFDQLFQRIHDLEGDLQKSQESTQCQLQLLRTDLEKNQGGILGSA